MGNDNIYRTFASAFDVWVAGIAVVAMARIASVPRLAVAFRAPAELAGYLLVAVRTQSYVE